MTRSPSPPHEETETVMGLRACLAVYARRRDEIRRIGFAPYVREHAQEMLRWAAAHDVPSREMHDDDLSHVADSSHHEGLCVLAVARKWTQARELAEKLQSRGGAALALDRVRNPYNVGAILRTAAFFGLDGVLIGAPAPHPALAPTAVRVAEGGAESVALSRTTDLGETLSRLRSRGIRIVGAESGAPAEALGFDYGRPVVVIVGNEREGLGDRVRAQCDALVAIRGAGAIESLNVSVASSLLIAELTRTRTSR